MPYSRTCWPTRQTLSCRSPVSIPPMTARARWPSPVLRGADPRSRSRRKVHCRSGPGFFGCLWRLGFNNLPVDTDGAVRRSIPIGNEPAFAFPSLPLRALKRGNPPPHQSRQLSPRHDPQLAKQRGEYERRSFADSPRIWSPARPRAWRAMADGWSFWRHRTRPGRRQGDPLPRRLWTTTPFGDGDGRHEGGDLSADDPGCGPRRCCRSYPFSAWRRRSFIGWNSAGSTPCSGAAIRFHRRDHLLRELHALSGGYLGHHSFRAVLFRHRQSLYRNSLERPAGQSHLFRLHSKPEPVAADRGQGRQMPCAAFA